MQVTPNQALAAAQRSFSPADEKPALLIAGAGGALGNAALRRLSGVQRFAHTQILAKEPIAQGMRSLSVHLVSGEVADWPLDARCDVAVVMFEPPRMFYERERALWTPDPDELTALAAWLRSCGAHTLALVLPHAQGKLPESLKRGLASLDEQAISAMHFERVIILRTAEKPATLRPAHMLEKLAQLMLGIFKFMVPAQEQPIRPTKIAEIVDALLQIAPRGIHVLGPQEMWSLAQCKDIDLKDVLSSYVLLGQNQSEPAGL